MNESTRKVDIWSIRYIFFYPKCAEAVRSSLAEEVIVEDVDCPVKPLEPEVVPLPSAPAHGAADQDPDSDGNETSTKNSHIAKE